LSFHFETLETTESQAFGFANNVYAYVYAM